MKVISLFSFFVIASATATLMLGAPAAEDTSPNSLKFTALSGEEIHPLKSDSGKPVAVIFITVDCPIANGYAPEISRIHDEFAKQGVKLTLVHVDPDLTRIAAEKHAKDYQLTAPVIIDRTQKLVARTGATITPEAAVLNGEGELIYLGRINDRYAALGDRKNNVKVHNLRNALEAALKGEKPTVARAEAIGCFIPEI